MDVKLKLLKLRFERLGIEYNEADIIDQLRNTPHNIELKPHQVNTELELNSNNIEWTSNLDSEANVEKFSYRVQVTKALSLNNMYLVGSSRGRAWTYLNPQIQKVKTEIIEGLNKLGIKNDFAKYKDKDVIMEVKFTFVFRENFWTRDVDNMVKYTSDAFTEASGVDDRRTVKMSQEKVINDSNWNEFIQIDVSVYSDKKRATAYASERIEEFTREETFRG